MSAFSERELIYLAERRPARIGTDPWRPRAVEVRGRAEAIAHPEALIRIHPDRIVS